MLFNPTLFLGTEGAYLWTSSSYFTSTVRSPSYSMMWKYASHPLHSIGAGSFAIRSCR